MIVCRDFQRGGWQPDKTLRMPGGTTVTPVRRAARKARAWRDAGGVAATGTAGGQERVTVTAGVMNRSGDAGDRRADPSRDRRAAVQCRMQISAAERLGVGDVRAADDHGAEHARSGGSGPRGQSVDALARDNVFNFVVTPGGAGADVGVAEARRRPTSIWRALAIGEAPRFERRCNRRSPAVRRDEPRAW